MAYDSIPSKFSVFYLPSSPITVKVTVKFGSYLDKCPDIFSYLNTYSMPSIRYGVFLLIFILNAFKNLGRYRITTKHAISVINKNLYFTFH